MPPCPYCGSSLAPGPPWAPGDGHRLAYDPDKGRLWNVCPQCTRWTLTPLDSRWETLQGCEEAVADGGKVLFSSSHLSLVRVGKGELIRVGAPPRPEFVDWRYGSALTMARKRPSFWRRILGGLPPPPVGGYDPYKGFEGSVTLGSEWFASPFLNEASILTYLFSQVPLAPQCPSCNGPLALFPWHFQDIEFLTDSDAPSVLVPCALCEQDVSVDLRSARPTLRLGLGLVTGGLALKEAVPQVAAELDRMGGAQAFLRMLTSSRTAIGTLTLPEKAGLIVSLDEVAEIEALEAEWRAAEEMALIMDGELSDVAGFESFRRDILNPGTDPS